MLRAATLDDLDALVALENACFDMDRISRRSFRYLLTKGRTVTLLYETPQQGLLGYVMLFFHRGTSLARLYSIAVSHQARGTGVGKALVAAAEQSAIDHGCVSLRLEVRPDNQASLTLFDKLGYRQFGRHLDYYEDHMDALRFEKFLTPNLPTTLTKVPFYQQTLDFTCGPASMMMAMKALDDQLELNRNLELRLWRESTTIFMTSGHGGCGPYGLALSAYRRGYAVALYVNAPGALFLDSVRSEEKREVMRLVQEEFMQELQSLPVAINHQPLSLDDLMAALDQGAVAVILISSWRIYREKFPHWVVVTGYDEHFIYVHDPYVDYEKGKSMTDCVNMPISQQAFVDMSRYGKSGLRAALLISKLTIEEHK